MTGNIIGIYNGYGKEVARYIYDVYGNHKVLDEYGIINNNAAFIGNINPFRYKGYYYDVETGFYYCNSRYYNSKIYRWITADDIDYLEPESINGLNLYVYCGNDPINYADPSGCFALEIVSASTAVYYLLIGIGIIALVATTYIASQSGFQNSQFDLQYSCQMAWNNLSYNISNTWDSIYNWWTKTFYYTLDSTYQDLTISNSLPLIVIIYW